MDDQDKPLENLFRDKAETFSDLSYREDDWTKLEIRLDELDLKKRNRRRIAILAAATLLFVSTVGYLTLNNYIKINEISEQINQLEESQKKESPTEIDKLARVDEPENSSEPTEGKESNEGVTDRSGTETKFDAMSEKKPSAPNKAESLSTIKSENIDKGEIIGRADRHILAQNTLLHRNHKSLINDEQIYASRNTPKNSSGNSFIASATGETSTRQLVSDTPFRTRSSVTLGFMFSPDLSTAGGISNFDDPGFKGGVLAEFSLSDRFSVRSGAILSNVRYKAGQNDYRAPENWNYGVSPEETSALCLILDIPISLKATMIKLDTSKFYITGGVSTYVMLSEEYKFDFGANASPYLTDEWQGQTGDRFWASNLSFSIGYELDISSRIALRAEPHIYIPIREVGWGNVKLYSVGTSVSLNVRM